MSLLLSIINNNNNNNINLFNLFCSINRCTRRVINYIQILLIRAYGLASATCSINFRSRSEEEFNVFSLLIPLSILSCAFEHFTEFAHYKCIIIIIIIIIFIIIIVIIIICICLRNVMHASPLLWRSKIKPDFLSASS